MHNGRIACIGHPAHPARVVAPTIIQAGLGPQDLSLRLLDGGFLPAALCISVAPFIAMSGNKMCQIIVPPAQQVYLSHRSAYSRAHSRSLDVASCMP